jgi:DNA-binding NarL/FixJ family response regulator
MRIVIAEDSALVRAGLVEVLTKHGHDVVAAVGDAETLRAAVAQNRPDVTIVDVRMPPGYTDEGRSNGAIAGILMVSDGAVEKHIGNIFSKLGLPPSDADHRRVLAVLRYLES